MPHPEKPRADPPTPVADDKATSPVQPAQEPPDLWKLIQGWVWKRFGMVGVVVMAVLGILWSQWDHVKRLPGVESMIERIADKSLPNAVLGKFNIGGKWETQVLINPYDETERSMLIFEFIQQGDSISGTVTERVPDGDHFAKRIVDGKVNGNTLSFYTQLEIEGDDRVYKELYLGTLNEKRHEIVFKRLNDLPTGGIAEEFIARRN